MPASAMEIREAEEEGVKITYLVAPVGIQQNGAGLKSVRLIRMELGEPDASGRRRPVEVAGSEFEVPVDNIITAIGQYSGHPRAGGGGRPGGREGQPGLRRGDRRDPAGRRVRRRRPGRRAGHRHPGHRRQAGGRPRAALAYLAGRRAQPRPEFLVRKEEFGEVTAGGLQGPAPRPPGEDAGARAAGAHRLASSRSSRASPRSRPRREAARCLECGCQDVHECRLKSLSQEYEAVATRFLGEVGPPSRSTPPIPSSSATRPSASSAGAASASAWRCRGSACWATCTAASSPRWPPPSGRRWARTRCASPAGSASPPARWARSPRSNPGRSRCPWRKGRGGVLRPVLGGLPGGVPLPRQPAGAGEGALRRRGGGHRGRPPRGGGRGRLRRRRCAAGAASSRAPSACRKPAPRGPREPRPGWTGGR